MVMTYTLTQVTDGANAAANAVVEALGGLTPERQALVDLLVNATIGFIEGDGVGDLADIVADAYDEPLDVVIGWIEN